MSGTIYTRRGDDGHTSLANGTRVRKDSERVEAYGTLDEANSAIGFARASLEVAAEEEARLDRILNFVQHRLMNCAASLAHPGDSADDDHDRAPLPTEADVARLERAIDELLAAAGEIDHFVLPAGCEPASRLHVARTVLRRAERHVTALAGLERVDPAVQAFVNRASDLLFAGARYANAICGTGDVLWEPAYGEE